MRPSYGGCRSAMQSPSSTAKASASTAKSRKSIATVTDLADTSMVADRLRSAGVAAVCHESAEHPLTDVEVPTTGDVVLVIGPEGSITDDELAAFADAGATTYRMGPTVLRTSTA